MNENTLTLKIRLGNVQEWLNLSERPLHCAQLACADVLKEVCNMNDKSGMITATDLAQAVNRAVVWCAHAQKLTKTLLDGSKAPVKVAARPLPAPSTAYECAACAAEFGEYAGVQPGDMCPHCKDGIVDLPIPF